MPLTLPLIRFPCLSAGMGVLRESVKVAAEAAAKAAAESEAVKIGEALGQRIADRIQAKTKDNEDGNDR